MAGATWLLANLWRWLKCEKVAAVALTLVVPIVAGMSVPAQAATSRVGYGGAAYAPWTDDQMTYRPEGTGPCFSLDDVRLRAEEAARESLSQPDPVVADRTARAKLNADLANMPVKCQVDFAWQVVTLANTLRRTTGKCTSARTVAILCLAPDHLRTPATDTTLLPPPLANAPAPKHYGPGNAWGAAMRMMDVIAGTYAVAGAVFALSSTMASNPYSQQTQQQLAAFAGLVGIAIEFVKSFVDWIANTMAGSPEHASGNGQGKDPNGDK